MTPRVSRITTLGVVACLAVATAVIAQQPQPRAMNREQAPQLDPADTGYAVGFSLGRDVITQLGFDGVTADTDALVAGFADALRSAEPQRLNQTEIDGLLRALERTVAQRYALERLQQDPVFAALAEENLRLSNQALEQFRQRPNTTQLNNGVSFSVLSQGQGPKAQPGDIVRVTYRASLADGDFVSDANERAVPVGTMIPGAAALILDMRAGERRVAAIPPDLAFSVGGRAPEIGPNQLILVDITLAGIEK